MITRIRVFAREGMAEAGIRGWRMLNEEILQVDARLRHLLQEIPCMCVDESTLLRETRLAKQFLQSLTSKIDDLSAVAERARLLGRKNDAECIEAAVVAHRKELDASRRALFSATRQTRAAMVVSARSSLLEGDSSARRRREVESDEKRKMESGERLSSLLHSMAERVAHSENAMETLVRSSESLAKTHEEYGSQAAFIQTGNKLLSKWERRELTDKILVVFALMFYFAAIYYVVNKRFLSKVIFW